MIIEDGVLKKVEESDIIDGKVVVPESVTSIGKNAFLGCHSLINIEIPDGVTSIGDDAFRGCSNLTSIKIPDEVTSIGKRVFDGCGSLISIEIPDGVTSIGDGVFTFCSNLTSIKIPDGVTSIGKNAFQGCTNLTSIKIPDGVTSIGDGAFMLCSNLMSIKIPDGVTSIEEDVFYDCRRLTSIGIPDGVTSIGKNAFDGCTNLTSIEIPSSVTSIGKNAFGNSNLELSEGRTTISENMFYGQDKLISIKIPDGVTSIGDDAFRGCSNLTSIKIPDSVTSIGENAFYFCTNLTSIEIPDSVTSIGENAFDGCSNLTSIEIPDSVTSIGANSFGSSNVELSEGRTTISENMFYGHNRLISIKIPDGVTSIGENAFYGCRSLTSIEIPDSVTSIGENAFYDCQSLTSIKIPDGVTSIGEHAFYDCQSLTSIKIPDGVTSIGEHAFERCSNLTSIEIPDSVTSIGKNTFGGCSNLTSIEIPNGVTSIGEHAFHGCRSLTSIEIPDGVTSIGNVAFMYCSNLTSIKIPDSVTSIGKNTFDGCSNLTSIKIPDGVTSIGEHAFYDCQSLTSIEIPDSVTSIGDDAFKGCRSLTSIEIPDSLRDRCEEAFIKNGVPVEAIFKENHDRIKQIKSKANFHLSQDFNEDDMNLLYYKMMLSIGIEEIERIVEIPNLTEEEVERYTLEKDEAFQNLYDTKYQIVGDLGITLNLLKTLDLSQKQKTQDGKNTQEMKLFKSLNQKLEEGYEGSLTNLVSVCLAENNIEIEPEDLTQIQDFEKSINKLQINETLQAMKGKIAEVLGTPTQEYPEAIVPMQTVPIQAMIEDAIRNLVREKNEINFEELKQTLDEKIGNAHAPYIVQHKEQIVSQILDFLQKDETFQKGMQSSPLNALKNTKQEIGGAWKYKLNMKLKEMGYSFSSLPSKFTKEEMEKFSELMGNDLESKTVSALKEGADREVAYKLLAEKDLPSLVTYKQLHDMFFSIHPPYSEEFKEYFKQHREEFWETPEYYGQFGRIHDNFKTIINDPKLKNMYKKGELYVDQIVSYLKEKCFNNQRVGDEELARLSSSVGKISTEEEFAKVQEVFDITRKRERTSIPPTKVTTSRFRGRMLDPDDVLNLFAGDITTCCQRFNDVGEGSMLLGSIEENGGIFVVEELDENGEPTNIIGQSLTIRQKGESGGYDRLTFDNIEIDNNVKARLSSKEHSEILEIYKQAGKQAIEKDKKFLQKQVKLGKITEEQYDSLVLKEVIAGTGYNDLKGLCQQPNAKIVVPDEARNTYVSLKGQKGKAWIDSAGGKAPNGSGGKPVILATMKEKELAEIEKRKIDNQWKVKIKPKEVPLWYGKVDEVETLSDEQITPDKIEKVKLIERIAFREEQQLLNENEVETAEDVEKVYGLRNMQIKLGSNEDWYLIYGENEQEISIADLALVGGINAQKNEALSKSNAKLAMAESSNEIYKLLLDASKKNKTIYCNATEDTSLVNIKKMLKKGLIDVKDEKGRGLKYSKNGLVYEETDKMLKGRNFNYDSEIQMFDLRIIPHQKEMEKELMQSEKWLAKVQESAQMIGTEKEEGLDEMRNQIREEWQEKDDAK